MDNNGTSIREGMRHIMANQDFGPGVIGASIVIKGSAQQVWELITDCTRITEWNPQCFRQEVASGGTSLGPNVRTINSNRRGDLEWPTHSKVTVFEPQKQLSQKVAENGQIWSFILSPHEEGVELTETRDSNHSSEAQRARMDMVLPSVGGEEAYTAEMVTGITETLQTIKKIIEAQ